jgi:hypothetical protein
MKHMMNFHGIKKLILKGRFIDFLDDGEWTKFLIFCHQNQTWFFTLKLGCCV